MFLCRALLVINTPGCPASVATSLGSQPETQAHQQTRVTSHGIYVMMSLFMSDRLLKMFDI